MPATHAMTLPHAAEIAAPPAPPEGGFFTYHGLWAPGVRLFRTLGFRAKAAIVSLCFAVPLALLAWQFFEARGGAIAFSAKEIDGVTYVREVLPLLPMSQLQRMPGATADATALAQRLKQIDAVEARLGAELGTARMHFHYRESFQISNNLEAYERLLLEVMLGNQALFTRSDGIERLWEVSAPVLENPPPIEFYPQGTWGPYSIERVIAPHRWTLPQ